MIRIVIATSASLVAIAAWAGTGDAPRPGIANPPDVDSRAVMQVEDDARQAPAPGDLNAPTRPGVVPACIRGVSKNLCDGGVRGGRAMISECAVGDRTCHTLQVNLAELAVRVLPNPEPCAGDTTPPIPCDAAGELAGQLVLRLSAQISQDGPCQLRGCWSGPFEIRRPVPNSTQMVTIARGIGRGTLGVGTHRRFACPTAAGTPVVLGEPCEPCRAVQLIPPDPDQPNDVPKAAMNLLGTLEGELVDPATGRATCRICVSTKGVLFAPVGANTGRLIPPSDAPWGFAGTLDGALICRCPQQ